MAELKKKNRFKIGTKIYFSTDFKGALNMFKTLLKCYASKYILIAVSE